MSLDSDTVIRYWYHYITMQQTLTETAALMARMKPEEVPAVWLTSYDIVSHAIDELLDEEIDADEEILTKNL